MFPFRIFSIKKCHLPLKGVIWRTSPFEVTGFYVVSLDYLWCHWIHFGITSANIIPLSNLIYVIVRATKMVLVYECDASNVHQ